MSIRALMLSVINLRVCRSSVRAISNASCDSDTAEFAAITAFSDAFAPFSCFPRLPSHQDRSQDCGGRRYPVRQRPHSSHSHPLDMYSTLALDPHRPEPRSAAIVATRRTTAALDT